MSHGRNGEASALPLQLVSLPASRQLWVVLTLLLPSAIQRCRSAVQLV
jgi:hypothetical protein